jgi:hypothetical protein
MKERILAIVALGFLFGTSAVTPVFADDAPSGISEKAQKQLKQRIDDSKDQIDMGLAKGWLKPDQADKLKKEVSDAYAMESDVKSKGYPKDDTAKLEKTITLLNQHVTGAAATKK